MNNLDKQFQNYDNRPIGFFDSGVGGLTVLDKVQKILPYENYLYFGDTKNMPYGEKSKSELLYFADKIFKFFEQKNVKAVVMACNTTSAVVYDSLKDNYNFKIYPIIQSVAGILGEMNIHRLGIFATPATIGTHIYSKEISKYNSNIEIIERACPEWVKIVEEANENDEDSQKVISSRLAEMLWYNPDKIVLGCTHYPYLIKSLSKFTDKIKFIDPALYFADFIKNDLVKNNALSNFENGNVQFFVSSNPENFQNAGKMFFDVKTLPELVE